MKDKRRKRERERKGRCRQTQDFTSYHVEVVTLKVVVCNPLKLKMKKVVCSFQCQTFLLASTFYTPTTYTLFPKEKLLSSHSIKFSRMLHKVVPRKTFI